MQRKEKAFQTPVSSRGKTWQDRLVWDFPGGSVVKNPPANAGGCGLDL